MNRCATCGKTFQHSLILADGVEAQQCLDCATSAPVPRDWHREQHAPARTHPPHHHRHPHGDGAHAEPHPHHHPHHYYDARDEQKKAWLAVSVLSVVAFLLVYGIWSQSAGEIEAARQEAAAVTNFVQELKGYDLGKPEGARQVVRRVDAMQELWGRNARAGEVQALRDRASATLRAHDTRRQIDGRMQALEQALQAPALRAPQLQDLHAEAVALTKDSRAFDLDAGTRAGALQARIAERALQALHAEAAGSTGAPALLAYAHAETEAAAMDRQAQGSRATLTPAFFTLRELLTAESDAVCRQVVTPEYLASVPVENLLAPDRQGAWRGSVTDGLAFRMLGGVLAVENTAGPGGSSGVIALGYQDGWRDFVLDFDCTVEQGRLRLYVRLAGAPDPARVPSLWLGPTGELPFALGVRGHGRIEVLGDRVRYQFDGGPAKELDAQQKARIGGIGIVLVPGSRALFTRFGLQKVR